MVDRRQTGNRVPIKTQEPKLLCRNQAQLIVVDDETHSGEKAERRRQMRETLFPGGTQNEDIVQVEDRSNSPRVEEGLQRLRHQRENERGQAKAEPCTRRDGLSNRSKRIGDKRGRGSRRP